MSLVTQATLTTKNYIIRKNIWNKKIPIIGHNGTQIWYAAHSPPPFDGLPKVNHCMVVAHTHTYKKALPPFPFAYKRKKE